MGAFYNQVVDTDFAYFEGGVAVSWFRLCQGDIELYNCLIANEIAFLFCTCKTLNNHKISLARVVVYKSFLFE